MSAKNPVFFISDCHLGAGSAEDDRARQARLLNFLDKEARGAAALYILGDLFDFWFEYRHAIPRRHFQILMALRRLTESGVSISYVGGNHDFWAGSFLAEEVGCKVYYEPTMETVQGRKLFLAHGDGMGRGEKSYRFFRTLLRHPLAIRAYRTIHPDLGIPIAAKVSSISRGSRDESRFDAEDLYNWLAKPRLIQGADAVVIGHYHHPTHLKKDSGEFLILGDWIKNNSFARLQDGVFTLCRWTPDGSELMANGSRPQPTLHS